MKKKVSPKKKMTPAIPRVGQFIYVDPSPECTGGMAKITEVQLRADGMKKVFFVKLDVHPRGFINWTNYLRSRQRMLEKKYGKVLAKYDPDDMAWSMPE
ncbi:MAG: hypothetical protein WC668_00770 [Patescibacteria group bacterium]